MTQELFDELLSQGEGETLDYKAVSYFSSLVAGLKKDKDAEFVKDVISFANTVREGSAYILIGVKEEHGIGKPLGIPDAESVDNAVLQQKLQGKVHPVPKFKSYPFVDKSGRRFDIIEIPIVWYSSPCIPTVTIGNVLHRNEIYLRRGSSNEKATFDETVRLKAWLDSIPKLSQINQVVKQKNKKNPKSFSFDEETIQKLFGNEAAEDEEITRLKEYYFKNDIYDKITVNLPLRILVGHKGIGKSALIKVAISEDSESGKLPIMIKPDDVVGIGNGSEDFLLLVRSWKEGLYEIIVRKALQAFKIHKNIEVHYREVGENIYNYLIQVLEDASEEGGMGSEGVEQIERFFKTPVINVYIDDLDRGWVGGRSDVIRISALLNAVRDISNTNRNIQFRISLRSDVYFLVRTSDESTDKIQGSVVWYKWSHGEILALLAKRVLTYFGKEVDESYLRSVHQADLATNLNKIIEPVFSGFGKWETVPTYRVLLSVIRKRPRDLVKLLTLAARNAYSRGSNYIMTKDLQGVFDEYSLDRIQDTINEYKSELPSIERLIFGMKPHNAKSLKPSDYFYYRTADLLRKINNLRERGEFRFSNGKVADSKDLAAFLYKINFITATKKLDSGYIERKDFEENRYLVSKFEDFGYDWEVHMAFRWGLQPSGQSDIFYEIV